MKKITEERVIIPGNVSIGGTLSYLDKETVSPAVVLISGTGKTDRDGNKKHFHTDFYKQLAALFVNLNYVCIRYDKRGTYETKGNFKSTGLHDLVDDAVSVIEYIKTLPFVEQNNVIVCGHSEGAQIATLSTNKVETAGLILIGGAATNMKDALLYQNQLAYQEFKNKKGVLGFILRKQTTPEKTNKKVNLMFQKSASTNKDSLFFGGTFINARWLREHDQYSSDDYTTILTEYTKPILAITGKADLSADSNCLEKLNYLPNIQVFIPDRVNHILREIDDENSMLTVKKQYLRLAKQPFQKDTLEKISIWLGQFK